MADDFISEEIEIGTGSTGIPETAPIGTSINRVVAAPSPIASPGGVEIGQVQYDIPTIVTGAQNAVTISPPPQVVRPSVPMSGESVSGSPTVNDLELVAAEVSSACLPISEIMSRTGLSEDVVIKCLETLMSDNVGTVVVDADRYCGVIAIKRMQTQLIACRNCRESA